MLKLPQEYTNVKNVNGIIARFLLEEKNMMPRMKYIFLIVESDCKDCYCQ